MHIYPELKKPGSSAVHQLRDSEAVHWAFQPKQLKPGLQSGHHFASFFT